MPVQIPVDFEDGDEVWIQDVLPVDEMVALLKQRLPSIEESRLRNGFMRYRASSEEGWFYTKEQALEVAQEIMDGFVEECLSPLVDGVIEEKTWAGEVAAATGLELIGEPAAIHGYRSIDGAW